jgi:hypothetical protein
MQKKNSNYETRKQSADVKPLKLPVSLHESTKYSKKRTVWLDNCLCELPPSFEPRILTPSAKWKKTAKQLYIVKYLMQRRYDFAMSTPIMK